MSPYIKAFFSLFFREIRQNRQEQMESEENFLIYLAAFDKNGRNDENTTALKTKI